MLFLQQMEAGAPPGEFAVSLLTPQAFSGLSTALFMQLQHHGQTQPSSSLVELTIHCLPWTSTSPKGLSRTCLPGDSFSSCHQGSPTFSSQKVPAPMAVELQTPGASSVHLPAGHEPAALGTSSTVTPGVWDKDAQQQNSAILSYENWRGFLNPNDHSFLLAQLWNKHSRSTAPTS